MGMSGLARGREPWVMKVAFVVRGFSALLLVAALPATLGNGTAAAGGPRLVLAVGPGVGGARPGRHRYAGRGRRRAPGPSTRSLALVAYLAGVAGAIMLSVVLLRGDDTAGLGVWALPLALTAAAAMAVQFVAFGAAAREAREARRGRPPWPRPGPGSRRVLSPPRLPRPPRRSPATSSAACRRSSPLASRGASRPVSPRHVAAMVRPCR